MSTSAPSNVHPLLSIDHDSEAHLSKHRIVAPAPDPNLSFFASSSASGNFLRDNHVHRMAPSSDDVASEPFSLFSSGDLNAFIALFTNNLATLLVVVTVLLPVLGDEITYGSLVPGVGWSTLFGNLYYVWMAWRMRKAEGRNDVCAQPYGINTPGAFVFMFSIILVDYANTMKDPSDPSFMTIDQRQKHAWYVGLASNFVAAIILLAGSTIGPWVLKTVPIVPLLTSLSGIGFSYLGLNALLDEFQYPLVGFVALFIFFLAYFGEVKFYIPGTRVELPAALLALVVGSLIGWADPDVGKTTADVRTAFNLVKAYAPVFTLKELFNNMDAIKSSISQIIPVAITVAIGTIQCVKTAHGEGDKYSIRDSMIGDGIGTGIAAIMGSPLGMTVYIGHPAYKRMGARTGYAIAQAVAFWLVCVFGLIGPISSIIVIASVQPIIVSIGLDICKETIGITPRRHYPAFLVGLIPSMADWALGITIASSIAAPWTREGLLNLSHGAILVSIVLTAIMMYVIDRDYMRLAAWCAIGSVASFFGLIHSEAVGWLVGRHDVSWKYTIAYGMIGIFAVIASRMQKMGRIADVRPESKDEAKNKEEEEEMEDNVGQPNACCYCI